MLIYDALKKDHEKVKSLLNQLLLLDDKSENRSELIDEIRDELIPHARAEEAVFYNSLRSTDAAKDIIMHAYGEHVEAEAMLKTLQMKDKIDADWKLTARKLKEALEHHIKEEEGRIFNVAKQVFTEQEAMQFGDAFERMKPEIKEEGFMGTTFDLIQNLMPPRFMKTLRGKDSNMDMRRNP
jgi:hemerythrin superfamily protein